MALLLSLVQIHFGAKGMNGLPHFKPARPSGQPSSDHLRGVFVAKLVHDSRRNQHAAVERRQQMLALNKNQIPERRGIGDNDHSIRSAASLFLPALFAALREQRCGDLALTPEIL